MNSVEKKLLQDDLAKAQAEMKHEVTKPKSTRNQRALNNFQSKVNTLKKWLKE